MGREEHNRILQGELRKLENRFFALFETERKEIKEKLQHEKEVIEVILYLC